MKTNENFTSKPTTIGILGIGGVGGFFGGLLAEAYHKNEDVKIAFLAQPESAAIIKNQGLTLIRSGIESISNPDFVSTDGTDVPKLDYLLCCTKSYDLISALNKFSSAISTQTCIIPLQNGVSSKPAIHKLFPKNVVTEGCVYIVSERIAPGVIEQTGDVHSLYFGLDSHENENLKFLEQIMQKAGIDAHFSPIIEEIVWEKFIFISAVANATTFLGKKIGAIRKNENDRILLEQLVDEAIGVAIAAGIKISADVSRKTLKKIKEMPEDSTSSMQRDFDRNKKTEYESLTKYMVELGDKFQIDTPGFDKIFNWFKKLDSSQLSSQS